MEILIDGGVNLIEWDPASEIAEIVQNVRTILGTVKGSVPLDREFGVDGTMLDMPMPRAQALYQQAVLSAIERYEPRARVVSVSFDTSDGMAGRLAPAVTIALGA